VYAAADAETQEKYSRNAKEKVQRMYEIKNQIMQNPDQGSTKDLVN